MRGSLAPSLLAFLLVLAACGGPRPPDVAMSTEPPPDAGVRLAAEPRPTQGTKKSDPPTIAADPMRCGCSLCEPVFSDDACTIDADCGPSAPCHADRCVGIAKARPRKPSDMCTLQLLCQTTDANGCGCLDGRCALYPRKK